jgi:hypothetical protein
VASEPLEPRPSSEGKTTKRLSQDLSACYYPASRDFSIDIPESRSFKSFFPTHLNTLFQFSFLLCTGQIRFQYFS